jgi:cell division protein FtsL
MLKKVIQSFFIILFICCVAFRVWCTTKCRQIGYEISAIAKENKYLIKERDRLKKDFKSLKSPHRIGDIAEKQFGLAAPEKGQTIIIK